MILVTGASGFLGAAVAARASALGMPVVAAGGVVAPSVPGVRGAALDLRDATAVGALVDRLHPEWIVHAAARTDVDWCETHPREAAEVNVEGTRHLADAARRAGARLLYVSTDAVFDGRRGDYREEDHPDPLNVYARTKLEGERAAGPRALVARTNFFGRHPQGGGLADWITRRLKAGRTVPGFVDVSFSPMEVQDLADLLLRMAEKSLEGIFHVGGPEALSKYEFARRLASVLGFEPSRVEPISVAKAGLAAPRPRNVSLCSERVARALGRPMPGLQSGLARYRAAMDQEEDPC
jgi:dTDP-4-dehydrorhamnose reductase